MNDVKNGRYINRYGTIEWYKEGLLHREDGPAIETSDGTKQWFIEGKQHREDGPALEYPSGRKEWFLNGVRHREDGPAFEFDAFEFNKGYKEWWIDGVKITEEEFNQWLDKKKLNEKLRSTLEEKPSTKKHKI